MSSSIVTSFGRFLSKSNSGTLVRFTIAENHTRHIIDILIHTHARAEKRLLYQSARTASVPTKMAGTRITRHGYLLLYATSLLIFRSVISRHAISFVLSTTVTIRHNTHPTRKLRDAENYITYHAETRTRSFCSTSISTMELFIARFERKVLVRLVT